MAFIDKNIFSKKDQIKELKKSINQLKENMIYSQQLSLTGSWTYELLKNEIFLSDEVYKLLGLVPEEFDGKFENFYLYVHPDDLQRVKEAIENTLKGKEYDIEYRILINDGKEKYIHEKTKALYNEENETIKIIGIIQDITEQKLKINNLNLSRDDFYEEEKDSKGENSIRTNNRTNEVLKRFQALIRQSKDVFEIITSKGMIEYVSPSVERVLGYKPEEIVNKNIFDFFDGKERKKAEKIFKSVLNHPDKVITHELMLKTKEEKKKYLEVSINNLLSEPYISGIVLNWRDITPRMKMENKIKHIATHDELTDLPNRIYFKKYLSNQCKQAKENQISFALMLLDINDFTYINNSLGYQSGDKLLIDIVERLKSDLGEEAFICRYSGVQFIIIIEGLNNVVEYEKKAKKIMGIFSNPFILNHYELYITASMGVSLYPNDGQDSDTLRKYTNIALIRAREEGRNQYKFYSSNMDILSYKQFELRNDLRKAIENDQLRVNYQPQVHLQTSSLLGAEALIRWEHPTWGMVPPNEFIYLAEETGIIINIGKWMLREVCENYKQWLKKGFHPIKISINYSSIQFFEKDFVKNIKDTIDEFGLNPNFLIIEITESILIKESKQFISIIQSLQKLGIQVALDDFGTGYSSLAYLNSLNIDIIKIDRSFINNINVDNTSTVVTSYIIDLARKLRLKLVAEGIENWEQLSFLQKENCYTGQGYLFSKPMAKDDFEKILRIKKCKPIKANDTVVKPFKERRKFFRIDFSQFLEGEVTIIEIKGKKAKVGNTNVLIKDIGPGGLCFISKIRFPIKRSIILQFTTELLGEEIKVYGSPVWIEEENYLYKYGIEFTFDENDRMKLTKILHQVQIKMRNNLGFSDGSFVLDSPTHYFKGLSQKK